MQTKVKRDCMIVALLVLALALTACAGKGEKSIDWTQLAADAAPSFGMDECGQTLTWSKRLGRWEIKDKAVVVEGVVVIRIDCDADGNVTATPE